MGIVIFHSRSTAFKADGTKSSSDTASRAEYPVYCETANGAMLAVADHVDDFKLYLIQSWSYLLANQ